MRHPPNLSPDSLNPRKVRESHTPRGKPEGLRYAGGSARRPGAAVRQSGSSTDPRPGPSRPRASDNPYMRLLLSSGVSVLPVGIGRHVPADVPHNLTSGRVSRTSHHNPACAGRQRPRSGRIILVRRRWDALATIDHMPSLPVAAERADGLTSVAAWLQTGRGRFPDSARAPPGVCAPGPRP